MLLEVEEAGTWRELYKEQSCSGIQSLKIMMLYHVCTVVNTKVHVWYGSGTLQHIKGLEIRTIWVEKVAG